MAFDKNRIHFNDQSLEMMKPGKPYLITPADAELSRYFRYFSVWVSSAVSLTNGGATVRIVSLYEDVDANTIDLVFPLGLTPVMPVPIRRVLTTGTTSGLVIHGYE